MPKQFDVDPLALNPAKPETFPFTYRERRRRLAREEAQRRQLEDALQQAEPLPSPSLVEPLPVPGLFGRLRELKGKTGFKPFHVPSKPNPTLRDWLRRLQHGGQYGI